MKAEALPPGIFQLCTEAVRGKQGCHPDQPLKLARISSLFSLKMQILPAVLSGGTTKSL